MFDWVLLFDSLEVYLIINYIFGIRNFVINLLLVVFSVWRFQILKGIKCWSYVDFGLFLHV